MKILFVGDMKSFLESGRNFLCRTDCELLGAATGAEAVMMALKLKPAIIVLDIDMPEVGGFETCRTIKSNPELCKTPVIITTAFDQMQESRDAGADDFVHKPINETIFLDLIKNHVNLQVRADTRVPFFEIVQLLIGGTESVAAAQNISLTGMAMSLTDPPAIGEAMTARFTLLLSDRKYQIKISCLVVRRFSGGAGARFFNLTAGDSQALREFIEG